MLLNHLRENNLGYFQHMKRALRISVYMFYAGFSCLVHSIFPFLFQKTATSIIKKLRNEITLFEINLSAEKMKERLKVNKHYIEEKFVDKKTGKIISGPLRDRGVDNVQ